MRTPVIHTIAILSVSSPRPNPSSASTVPASTICATDLGQTTNPGLQEGFEIFIDHMLDFGFSEADIKRMTQHNAAALLGAE